MIGNILATILKEKNMNVNQLAKQSNISVNTLYGIIKRNNTKVDFNILLTICETLNVDIEIFYNDFLKNKKKENSLSERENNFITDYQKLNDNGKIKAEEYITDLSEQEKYTK